LCHPGKPGNLLGMAHEDVLNWLAAHAPDISVIVPGISTATVAEAAAALGVEPGRIAKTLAMRVNGEALLLVTRGDARLDNPKSRAALGGKPRMLDADETLALTGHAVGGVCPFGLLTPLPVWLDVSLRNYSTVFPAAGSRETAVEIPPDRLAALVSRGWVDACKLPETLPESV
jgi:prolyl-tRNA editing enzyme YbaK/EbsC (Cys-tRNA(Pro) deacylase)